MRVIARYINWMLGWGNSPDIVLVVDKFDHPEYKYVKKPIISARPSTLYFAHDNDTGLVSFHAHVPSDQAGYGGAEFTLNMLDGTTEKIKGPWSSRSGYMNNHFHHSWEVTIRETNGGNWGAHMRIDKLQEQVAMIERGMKLVHVSPKTPGDDIRYELNFHKPTMKEVNEYGKQ